MFAQITLIGNVGQEPELRHTQAGVPVCNFSMAVNRTWTDSAGQQQEKVTWFRITAWRSQAEACHQSLKKGDRVLIVSEIIDVGPWIDQTGMPRANIEVVPRIIRFLASRAEISEVLDDAPESLESDSWADATMPF